MRNALLAVDLQADFVQGGSLPVPNGMPVAAMIARHIRHFKTEYHLVVASRDYHEDPPDHFSLTPDFVTTWPPHCVIGTPGATFVPPIANLVREKLIHSVVSKGRHNAAYSAFEGVDSRGHPLLDVLTEARIDHIDICGIATDYCVRSSALDARKNSFPQVRILLNLCAAVNEATGLQALEEMKVAGCQLQAATAP
ncbi:MAG TPA: isochorismatase family protein [Candidatus Dormibacteraeota bacterium]|nr:isochorismatase family protein [Candidatus Dormibacteraeota bacterium]